MPARKKGFRSRVGLRLQARSVKQLAEQIPMCPVAIHKVDNGLGIGRLRFSERQMRDQDDSPAAR
jgi:hypothetical protein